MQRKRKKHNIHILRECIVIKNEIRIEDFLKENGDLKIIKKCKVDEEEKGKEEANDKKKQSE